MESTYLKDSMKGLKTKSNYLPRTEDTQKEGTQKIWTHRQNIPEKCKQKQQ